MLRSRTIHYHMINSFRTKVGNAQYDAYRRDNPAFRDTCVLCDKTPLRDFTWWKIIENAFPYDRIASLHHMLIPKRHTTENGLTPEERNELQHIKDTGLDTYQFLIEPTHAFKSIPNHFHLHLIVCKEIACDPQNENSLENAV